MNKFSNRKCRMQFNLIICTSDSGISVLSQQLELCYCRGMGRLWRRQKGTRTRREREDKDKSCKPTHTDTGGGGAWGNHSIVQFGIISH